MFCGDRAGEDERVLADVADQLADGLAADRLERDAAQGGLAAAGMGQPHQGAEPGRLAAARTARHADRLAVADRHRQAVERALRRAAGVADTRPPGPRRRTPARPAPAAARPRRPASGTTGRSAPSSSPSRSPIRRLLSCASSMKRWISFERGHHAEEQHREREHVARPGAARARTGRRRRPATRTWKNPSLIALPAPKSDISKWCRSSLDRRRSAALATRRTSCWCVCAART